MWQQTVEDVLQKAVKQKIEYVKDALSVMYLLFFYVCSLWLKHWFCVCSHKFQYTVCATPCTGISVCSCVFLRAKRGSLTKEESLTREKKWSNGCLSNSQQVGALLFYSKLFISLLYYNLALTMSTAECCQCYDLRISGYHKLPLFISIECRDCILVKQVKCLKVRTAGPSCNCMLV